MSASAFGVSCAALPHACMQACPASLPSIRAAVGSAAWKVENGITHYAPPPSHTHTPLPPYLSTRVKQLLTATISGTAATVNFVVSVPGRLGRFAALPRAERKEIYAGWWAVVKREAKHYWVRGMWGWTCTCSSNMVAKHLLRKKLKSH